MFVRSYQHKRPDDRCRCHHDFPLAPRTHGGFLHRYCSDLRVSTKLARRSAPFLMSSLDRLSHAVWVATFQLPLYDLGDIEDVGRRAGMMMTITSFGSVGGPPISGALIQATGGFAATGYFAGSMMLLSCVLALITRQLVLKTHSKHTGSEISVGSSEDMSSSSSVTEKDDS